MQQQLAVVQSDKEFGLLGGDILPRDGLNTLCDEKLPEVRGYKGHVNLITGSLPMFCKARKIPQPLQNRTKEELETRASRRQCNQMVSQMHPQYFDSETKMKL